MSSQGEKISKQVYLSSRLCDNLLNCPILLILKLIKDAILGCDWLNHFQVKISFEKVCVSQMNEKTNVILNTIKTFKYSKSDSLPFEYLNVLI